MTTCQTSGAPSKFCTCLNCKSAAEAPPHSDGAIYAAGSAPLPQEVADHIAGDGQMVAGVDFDADLARVNAIRDGADTFLAADNITFLIQFIDCLWKTYSRAANEADRLSGLINNPHTGDFLEAVRLEAAHQRERWGTDHDAGKTDAEWFWLIGHLASKAMMSGKRVVEELESTSIADNDEAAAPHRDKRLHHIITTAAALLNWHAGLTGADNRMRPGIAPPAPFGEAKEQHE